jgi:hypothetical protein
MDSRNGVAGLLTLPAMDSVQTARPATVSDQPELWKEVTDEDDFRKSPLRE